MSRVPLPWKQICTKQLDLPQRKNLVTNLERKGKTNEVCCKCQLRDCYLDKLSVVTDVL